VGISWLTLTCRVPCGPFASTLTLIKRPSFLQWCVPSIRSQVVALFPCCCCRTARAARWRPCSPAGAQVLVLPAELEVVQQYLQEGYLISCGAARCMVSQVVHGIQVASACLPPDDNLDLRSLTRLGLLSIGRGGQVGALRVTRPSTCSTGSIYIPAGCCMPAWASTQSILICWLELTAIAALHTCSRSPKDMGPPRHWYANVSSTPPVCCLKSQ
jgi:hypothetical protein